MPAGPADFAFTGPSAEYFRTGLDTRILDYVNSHPPAPERIRGDWRWRQRPEPAK